MKYEIGTVVILTNEKQVYITGYNQKTKKYEGFDIENSDSKKTITFTENQVLLTV